jgi:hypothetical protein
MTDYPITPPPELRCQWQSESPFRVISVEREDYMIDLAAQWGADQELEACCDTLQRHAHWDLAVCELMADRRPKPPSLKDQALEELEQLRGDANSMGMGFDAPAIRRALEALDD